MYDLIGTKHGKYAPNAHINGTYAVDFLFVMADAMDPTKEIGMLPFQCGIDLDHRAIICDINQHHLLRGIYTKYHQIPQRKEEVSQQFKKYNIVERAAQLERRVNLDKNISATMIKLEQKIY
eukprot:10025333-Ditylum_brightwellii.AAC.1